VNDLFKTTYNYFSLCCYQRHVMFHYNEKLSKVLTVRKFYSDKRKFSFVFVRLFLCYSYQQVALICVLPQSEDSYMF
jgi:hypothetical protein